MAVILAITILGTGLIGSYTTVPAAEFSAGAIAAGETLEWITAALAGAGISISVKELLKPRQAEIEKDIGKHIDWDNYDWGDALDSPAAQDQIDELDKTINKLYGNASAKWKEMYEKSLSPTPTPETSPDKPDPSPPVTVAPIDPDTVTPPGWDTLRKASMKNGYLLLGTATYWCLKEAVSNWWDSVMETENEFSSVNNPYTYGDLIGYQEVKFDYNASGEVVIKVNVYDVDHCIKSIRGFKNSFGSKSIYRLSQSNGSGSHVYNYVEHTSNKNTLKFTRQLSFVYGSDIDPSSSFYTYINQSFHFYVPCILDGQSYDAEIKPMGKSGIWVNPDLKNDHDNNKSPSIPATAPAPAIKIPSLDDLKDLQNRGNNANDDERPSIILDWLKNHYTNPSTDPNPKPDPNPNPNPNPKPDPDTNPDPNPNPDPDPNPNPNPDPDPDPKPTTAPKPDDTNTDVNPDDYKADLRLVFPFCIPFDLVHLIQAFEAEPEAPVFEFPFDLELENPWTGKKILDYHHVFKLDMSDYEPVIKIFRIFEIIFFIIGLLMITRQQMIKG